MKKYCSQLVNLLFAVNLVLARKQKIKMKLLLPRRGRVFGLFVGKCLVLWSCNCFLPVFFSLCYLLFKLSVISKLFSCVCTFNLLLSSRYSFFFLLHHGNFFRQAPVSIAIVGELKLNFFLSFLHTFSMNRTFFCVRPVTKVFFLFSQQNELYSGLCRTRQN